MATQPHGTTPSITSPPQEVEKHGDTLIHSPSTPDDNNSSVVEAARPSPQDVEYEYISGFVLWILMACITVICFLMLLDISVIVTWTFLTFFFIFELGSLLCGVATSSNMLIVGRAVAGIGASGLLNGGLTIVAWSVPLEKRPLWIGAIMGIGQLGIALGPLVGGALTQYATWRWCFYLNLPAGGLVSLLIFFIKVPDGTSTQREVIRLPQILTKKFDLIGFTLFAPAAIQFLLALQYGGNQFAWNSSTVIGLFCGAGATFILFLYWEYRMGDDAMIPFSMIRVRIVWASCLVTFFMLSTVFLASYYLPIYFQGVRGVSPMTSGVDLLPGIVTQIFFVIVSGVLVGKLGYYLPWVLMSCVLGAVAHGLISMFSPTTPAGQWVGFQILMGVGRGIGVQMPIVAIQNILPQSQVSVAMSTVMFSQTFGGGFFLTLAEVIFSNTLTTELRQNVPDVDPGVVIAAGATAIRKVVSAGELEAVLMAYDLGIKRVFYLAAGSSAMAFVCAWGMGWKDIRSKEGGRMKMNEVEEEGKGEC